MRFSWVACLVAPLTCLAKGSPIQLGVGDEVDMLVKEAFQNKIGYDSRPQASNKTCTVQNAPVRREW